MRRKSVPEVAWQLPQGGIRFSETPTDAVWREVEEETGLTRRDIELVAQSREWIVYELPAAFRSSKVGWGQAQRWFLFRATSPVTVRPDGNEFDAFDWLTPAELIARTIAFRVPVYTRVFAEFEKWLR
jgi:putative (di)nucleoside polyphosphate hydrolase